MPASFSRHRSLFAPLAEAYAFLDASLKAELERAGRRPACAPGCFACCLQPIPASLAEVMGIQAYMAEHRLAAIPDGDPDVSPGDGSAACLGGARVPNRCPFLREGTCLVYPARPFACRRYLVFGRPCSPGEEPLQSRPGDVHRPSQAALLHALNMTLPLYGIAGIAHGQREERDFFTRHTVLLRQVRWVAGADG